MNNRQSVTCRFVCPFFTLQLSMHVSHSTTGFQFSVGMTRGSHHGGSPSAALTSSDTMLSPSCGSTVSCPSSAVESVSVALSSGGRTRPSLVYLCPQPAHAAGDLSILSAWPTIQIESDIPPSHNCCDTHLSLAMRRASRTSAGVPTQSSGLTPSSPRPSSDSSSGPETHPKETHLLIQLSDGTTLHTTHTHPWCPCPGTGLAPARPSPARGGGMH